MVMLQPPDPKAETQIMKYEASDPTSLGWASPMWEWSHPAIVCPRTIHLPLPGEWYVGMHRPICFSNHDITALAKSTHSWRSCRGWDRCKSWSETLSAEEGWATSGSNVDVKWASAPLTFQTASLISFLCPLCSVYGVDTEFSILRTLESNSVS